MSGYGFRVPVSGQKIPRGWFAALVRFMNSLVLRGDGRFTMVSRDESGTSVTLTPAAVAALTRAADGTPGAGVAQSISCEVIGSTAFLSLSGSTASVPVTGSGAATITGSTTGGFTVDVPGGTSSGSAYPVWGSLVPSSLAVTWSGGVMSPVVLPDSGYLRISFLPDFYLYDDNASQEVTCVVYVDGRIVWSYVRELAMDPPMSGGDLAVNLTDNTEHSAMIPVHSGSTVTAAYSDSADRTAGPAFTLYADTSS